MKIKKKYIRSEEVCLPINEDGESLSQLVKQFLNGEISDVESLVFLVEQNETHDVFYGVQFNIDETDPNEIFRDIYISSNVIDYTISDNKFIEVDDEHIGNLEFADKLLEQLEKRPCASRHEIVVGLDFEYVTARSFMHTEFEVDVRLLDN